MIKHDGKVFAFEIADKLYELYRIKTVRKHKIYVDKFGQYYATWNDFWHVFNNLEESIEKHWSIYKPIFIHGDHKRFVSKKLSKFKRELKTENWDVYLDSWDHWENLLFGGENTLEIDLSETNVSNFFAYVGFNFKKFNSLGELIEQIENKYLHTSNVQHYYNKTWLLINTYTGQKVINNSALSLQDSGIHPGTILKVVYKS